MKRLDKYNVPIDVREFVKEYIKENLAAYELVQIIRKSTHPDDDYLYMVSAKHTNGTYAVWTCVNMSTKSMNHGHYGLDSIEACEKIFEENYFNI